MKYQSPFRDDLPSIDVALTNNPADTAYVNGDPAVAREGSIPPAAAFEQHQRELVHLINYSTQVPSNADLEQVRKAIQWMIDRKGTLASVGGGIPVYEGYEALTHKIRSLIAGTNVTLETVQDGSTGDYAIRISATGGGGGGSTTVTIGNSGAGVAVYKGTETGVERFRTLTASGGITVTASVDGNTVDIAGSASLAVANVGTGQGLFKVLNGSTNELRSLKAGPGIGIATQNSGTEVLLSNTAIAVADGVSVGQMYLCETFNVEPMAWGSSYTHTRLAEIGSPMPGPGTWTSRGTVAFANGDAPASPSGPNITRLTMFQRTA